jgi:hypothetical protein
MDTAKGRQPNEKPVYREGELEAIVTRDERIKEIVPSANGIAASVSFNAFQALRAEFPDASVDEILQIWKSRVDKAGDAYASKLTGHLQSLHDDFMAVARLRSLDAKDGVPQKVGMRPTTDDARSINGWFLDRLRAFRGRFDREGLGIIEAVRLWAGANRHKFTKTAASWAWHGRLRFRQRYMDIPAALVAQERKERIEEVAIFQHEGTLPGTLGSSFAPVTTAFHTT